MSADAVALFRDAIAADRKYLEAVRAPLAYRPLTEAGQRLSALIEQRIADHERCIAKLQEAEV